MPQPADTPKRIPLQNGIRHGACIKVVSVGGGGSNAINRMLDLGLKDVEFISVNTDLQSLRSSKAPLRLHVGARLTHGLGAGGDPDRGRKAALDGTAEIIEALEGADMVFVAAGLGGGTGTGAAPIVAAAAGRMGALTVAIVTLPFSFEGRRRMKQAEQGLQELLDHVDTLIVIPNDRLLASAKDMGFFESFLIADDVVRQAVQGISDIITVHGVINRDFADVRTTMAGMGYGMMGAASRSGPRRAAEAARAAIASPLLVPGAIKGARGILINIAGSNSLRLSEVHEASTIIQRAAYEDANITFGVVFDERLGDEMKVTVIATGFDQASRERAQRGASLRSSTERSAVSLRRRPQPQPAVKQPDGLTDTHLEQGQSKPGTIEGTAKFDQEVDSGLKAPQSLVHEGYKVKEDAHLSQESSARQGTSLVMVHSEQNSLDASPQSTEDADEEYLLTLLEGLPFDSKTVANEASFSGGPEPPPQPEMTRGRQAALAAYTSMSTTESKSSEQVAPEAISFADVLASRGGLYGTNTTEADDQPDEALPDHSLIASAGDQVQMKREDKDASNSESGIARSQISSAGGMIEPQSDLTSDDLQFIDGADTPSSAEVGPLFPHDPSMDFVVRRNPTPDFNQRLHREPEFSMGVEVI